MYLWYLENIWRKSAIPDTKNVSGMNLCRLVGGLSAKCANFWLSGRHVADMLATFPAKIVKLLALDSPPFDIGFHHAMCTVPPLSKAQHASHLFNIIAEVENLQQCVLGKQRSVPALSAFLPTKKQKLIDKLNKHVSFDVCVHRHDVNSMLHHCPVVTVGGSLEPNFDVDVSVCDDLSDDVPLST
jgi:hypothetical protein